MSEFRYKDIESLCVELPEEIVKKKWFGDFEGAKRLIDIWLERDIPDMQRAKLELEREILDALPKEYVYTKEQAVAKLKERVPGMTEEEFDNLKEHGKIDWIYVNGQEKYLESFVDTLFVVNEDIRRRGAILDPTILETSVERKALYEMIKQVREKKRVEYYFRIRASIKIADDIFMPGHVKVYLPIPCNCKEVRDVKILEASSSEYIISGENAFQRTIYFEEDITENHEFFVEYSFISRSEYIDIDPENITPVEADMFQYDLCEKAPHIMFTPYLRSLAKNLTAGIRNPYMKARRIYDYITSNVEYSYVRNYFSIENLPEYAALGKKGDCGIQALLFITLCRIVGIPARWQSGLYVTPYSAGEHDWAQFYVEPYGWLQVDCSFGGTAYREKDEERRNFYFGNLDPFRMPANSDFQEEFVPAKSFLRIDPYDNQCGEIEYEDRGLRMDEVISEMKVMESHIENERKVDER